VALSAENEATAVAFNLGYTKIFYRVLKIENKIVRNVIYL
jgi:hypothetical protein